MDIQIDSSISRRFSYIDSCENYLTLDTGKAENSEGLIYRNQTLFTDFALLENKKGYQSIQTRFDHTSTTIRPECFTVNFRKAGTDIKCALFSNLLYFDCRNFTNEKAMLVLICSIEIAKKLDKKQCISSSSEIEVIKPDTAQLLQITKTFGKKALYSRIISFDKGTEFYISLEHSPAMASRKAKKALTDNAFDVHCKETEELLSKSSFTTNDEEYNQALAWSKFSALQFLNGNKTTKGLWAGLPWFRDYWCRDIFVSVPGCLLLSGNYREAEEVFHSFIKHQDTNPRSMTYGRLPNIYRNSADIIYNTADATLWFIREVYEFAQFTGSMKFLKETWDAVSLAIECDRNLRTDSSGFLLHGDADTWMDTRIFGEKSFSPRGNRANDIQVLWFTALSCGSRIASLLGKKEEAETWSNAARKVKSSFLAKFYDGTRMADCILKDDSQDFRVRPNQLMLITIPRITGERFISEDAERKITENAVSELLFPYGICSLSQNDPFFHPYHDTCDMYHKDAAYHNGTIWSWNAGFTIGSLTGTEHTKLAWQLAKNISNQILNKDVAGSISENISAYPDEDGSIHFSGAYSTCRGNSEFVRSAWEYFLGFKVDLLEKKISFAPSFPDEWTCGNASIELGLENPFTLNISWKKEGDSCNISLRTDGLSYEIETQCIYSDGIRTALLSPDSDGKDAAVTLTGKTDMPEETLAFTLPLSSGDHWKKPECLLQKNFLAEIALANKFNGEHPVSLTVIR